MLGSLRVGECGSDELRSAVGVDFAGGCVNAFPEGA